MNAWSKLEIGVFVTGFAAAFAGDKLAIEKLTYVGIVLFGVACGLIGLEGIITGRISLGSRREGDEQTYVGWGAYAQGVLFIVWGCLFIGAAFLAFINVGDKAFAFFVRRPGILLLLFSAVCLMSALSAISGSMEEKQGERWIVLMNLLVSRLLPGVILVVIGLLAFGLGLLDVFAPVLFDRLGGGFLEVLFGVH